MNTETVKQKIQQCRPNSGCFYGMGAIGAAIYFISQATGFWMGALGLLKAMVWPVFFVYEAFKHFGI